MWGLRGHREPERRPRSRQAASPRGGTSGDPLPRGWKPVLGEDRFSGPHVTRTPRDKHGRGGPGPGGWTGSPRCWPGRALRAPCGQRAQGLRASWPGGLDSPARLAEPGPPGGPGTVHPNSTHEPDPRPADPTHQHMDPTSPSEPSTVRTRPPDWTKPGPPIGPGTVPPNPAHPIPRSDLLPPVQTRYRPNPARPSDAGPSVRSRYHLNPARPSEPGTRLCIRHGPRPARRSDPTARRDQPRPARAQQQHLAEAGGAGGRGGAGGGAHGGRGGAGRALGAHSHRPAADAGPADAAEQPAEPRAEAAGPGRAGGAGRAEPGARGAGRWDRGGQAASRARRPRRAAPRPSRPLGRRMSAGGRDEERRKLADIIQHWNANRLDLFEISQPTEVRAAGAGGARSPARGGGRPDRGARGGGGGGGRGGDAVGGAPARRTFVPGARGRVAGRGARRRARRPGAHSECRGSCSDRAAPLITRPGIELRGEAVPPIRCRRSGGRAGAPPRAGRARGRGPGGGRGGGWAGEGRGEGEGEGREGEGVERGRGGGRGDRVGGGALGRGGGRRAGRARWLRAWLRVARPGCAPGKGGNLACLRPGTVKDGEAL